MARVKKEKTEKPRDLGELPARFEASQKENKLISPVKQATKIEQEMYQRLTNIRKAILCLQTEEEHLRKTLNSYLVTK